MAEVGAASPAFSVTDSALAQGRATRTPKGLEEAAPYLVWEPMGQPGLDADQPEAATEQVLAGDDAMVAEMAYLVSAGEDSDGLASDVPPPSMAQDMAPPAKPAAQWDRATDTVRFNWPEIKRTALQAGPNQVMAKLLVTACAEGANSRWPF